ncbi:DUF3182 family protein [Allopusillimonas ginsengisoli]|uniref:DUF3182 family protein n=1 Tax=Allopusillimonas ginsengisoli TaxID=453575 RepID=UPI00101FA0D6|nr:DUF3182 family protein [Allopusillimonas ginsengisoli]TEA79644.1 DUF3182 family protein [Allopusillimonas ginsengisoli]
MSLAQKRNQGTAGTVLIYSTRRRESDHESAVHAELARRLAGILDMEFGGHHQTATQHAGRVYLLPTDTIIGTDHALRLGLRDETDLFGGAAPHAFLPTKAITHPVFDADAAAPSGWSHEFGRQTRHAVLQGFTAFSIHDAQRAAMQMLQYGPVRIKPVLATAGRGQTVIANASAMLDALARFDTEHLAEYGLVLEENLQDVETFSVGRVRVGEHLITYVGTQSLTPDNQGELVYGGSCLLVVRGDFDRLLALPLDENSRDAIAKARMYDSAATACYPGLLASRRNYDIARGRNHAGSQSSGVLEQSWRTGGASAAEIAAIESLRENPLQEAVYASTVELFGDEVSQPPDAQLLYQGTDSEIGPICKYVTVRPYRRPGIHAHAALGRRPADNGDKAPSMA